jgi:hypothetical protein
MSPRSVGDNVMRPPVAEWLTSYSHDRDDRHMSTTTKYRDSWISPRFKMAALWASMMLVFAYVDLFGTFRADIRADLEAGKMFVFTIGQGFLLGITLYVALPSLMVFLSLVLPVKLTRLTNIVLPVIYGITIVGGAVGEWNYYILGSAIEVALLAGIAYYAWTWPKTTATPATSLRDERASHLV